MSFVVKNLDTGVILADQVAVASTHAERRTGLLKHTSLEPGKALWITPSNGVHTFGMKFTIDVIAIDAAGYVIDRVPAMKPWRIRLPRKGTAGVLELAEGVLEQTGTLLGHRVAFQTRSSE